MEMVAVDASDQRCLDVVLIGFVAPGAVGVAIGIVGIAGGAGVAAGR